MNKQNERIQSFAELALWYSTLSHITSEARWYSPIKKGKWCTAEIIAHLCRWDEYLITTLLPEAETLGKVEFPDHNEYNAASSAFALSGILPATLLNQAIVTRNRLVQKLSQMTEQQFFQPITINGHTHCPQTNTPNSIGYLILEFIQHDGHHRTQVESFLIQPQT